MVAGGGEEPVRAVPLVSRSMAFQVGHALIILGITSVLVATQLASAA
jgi:hypothetical protein